MFRKITRTRVILTTMKSIGKLRGTPRPSSAKKPPVEVWGTASAIRVETLSVVAQPEYVAWIDLMGARRWMAGSIRRAAEMISLIHVAGRIASKKHEVACYPVIDGVYIVGSDKKNFQRAASLAMRTLAETFLAQDHADRRFLVRGGIAYGRVLHGQAIAKLHENLENDESYSRCLALGIAIGHANEAEGKAPPFGFYVDNTARSTASVDAYPFLSSFFRWWSVANESLAANNFGIELDKYFDYLCSRRRELEYPKDRLQEHRELAKEYFNDITHDVTFRSR